jgi:hypothetical protein
MMNSEPIDRQSQQKQVDSTFTSLDLQRNQGLEQLKMLQTVQNSALEQEQKRLTAKYGIDHPRVEKINSRLIYNQGLFRDLDAEIDRSQIQVPTVDLNSWLGHGFVLDRSEDGIAGLTVSFYNAQEPIPPTWLCLYRCEGLFCHLLCVKK